MDQQNSENDEDTKKCSCGMPFNPRIVGGNEAKANSVPWQVETILNLVTVIEAGQKLI